MVIASPQRLSNGQQRDKANMAVPASTLRTLHRIHRQLTDLRSRLDRGPKQIAAGEANLMRLAGLVDEAKAEVQKTQLATSQKELQLKDREGRIEDVRGKLNSASTNKEYQTLVEQIAADEQANSVLSDEILELFDKVEQVQAVVGLRQADLAKGNEEFGKLKQRIEGERGSMEADVARLTQECTEAEASLPDEVKQDFQRIVGARGEDGLASVEGEFCGHCNQRITPQMFNELLMEKLVLCKSCGAILYLPEDREPKRHADE